MLTAKKYVETFETIGRHWIGIPAPCATSGCGYAVGSFEDGTVLRVGDKIVEYTTRPVCRDTLATVGRLLAGLSPETRAAQLAELGCKPGGTITLSGTRWDSAGNYLGLEAA